MNLEGLYCWNDYPMEHGCICGNDCPPPALSLDPKPYVTYANERRTDVRSATWDIQSHGGTEYVRVFQPRPQYSQNEEDYA